MMSGTPAGQHCPMSSRYTLPSACAFRAASKCTCAAGVSFGYGGPKRHDPGKPRSTNHVPVISNAGFGRGFDRFAGAKTPSSGCDDVGACRAEAACREGGRSGACCAETATVANVSAITTATTSFLPILPILPFLPTLPIVLSDPAL